MTPDHPHSLTEILTSIAAGVLLGTLVVAAGFWMMGAP